MSTDQHMPASFEQPTTDDGLWSAQFVKQRDFALRTARPKLRYVIASTPRSGSHYLGQMLTATGVLGDPLEYFNSRNRVRWTELATTVGEDVQRYIERRRTTSNGCFGMKLHLSHVPAALKVFGPHGLFDSQRFVWIRRRDLLGQAISYGIARQTHAWISSMASQREATYDANLITDCLREITLHESQWRALLSLRGNDYLELTYEDVLQDPQTAVAGIAGYVSDGEIELPDCITPSTRRQASDLNAAWRERYVTEMRVSGDTWAVASRSVLGVGRQKRSIRRAAMKRLVNIARR